MSTEVTQEERDNAVEDERGVKYSKDWKKLIKAPDSIQGSYTIRKGTLAVCEKAFSFCASLSSIEIPDSVTNIGNRAFYDCKSLSSIEIPDSVISIGERAF